MPNGNNSRKLALQSLINIVLHTASEAKKLSRLIGETTRPDSTFSLQPLPDWFQRLPSSRYRNHHANRTSPWHKRSDLLLGMHKI